MGRCFTFARYSLFFLHINPVIYTGPFSFFEYIPSCYHLQWNNLLVETKSSKPIVSIWVHSHFVCFLKPCRFPLRCFWTSFLQVYCIHRERRHSVLYLPISFLKKMMEVGVGEGNMGPLSPIGQHEEPHPALHSWHIFQFFSQMKVVLHQILLSQSLPPAKAATAFAPVRSRGLLFMPQLLREQSGCSPELTIETPCFQQVRGGTSLLRSIWSHRDHTCSCLICENSGPSF